jgi:pimeloyl-ACP methyl ester carboxylesterase
MRRVGLGLVLVLAAALALPPLWFRLFRQVPPELPPPGRRVALASGVGVNVVEQGAGPAVVLVHGLPGSAYDWRATSAALAARGRRAIAYDRVGYGWSDARPDGAFSVAANAAELVALLDALELRGVTLVGWSYGGSTAIAAAERDASRIARLVLVGSAGPGFERSQPPRAVARVLFSAPVLGWLHAVPPLARGVQAQTSRQAFSDGPEPDWWRPSLAANFGRPHTPASWRSEGAALMDAPLPEPSGLALPVVVLHGDDDRLVPVAVAHELARRAPGARLVVVPGGSHMLPITHADLVADEIVNAEALAPPTPASRASRG